MGVSYTSPLGRRFVAELARALRKPTLMLSRLIALRILTDGFFLPADQKLLQDSADAAAITLVCNMPDDRKVL